MCGTYHRRNSHSSALAGLIAQRRRGRIDRRTFMTCTAALLSSIGLGPAFAAAAIDDDDRQSPAFWSTVAAVQAHLFPPLAGSPGIADINATAYLGAALIDPEVDAEERKFVAEGVPLLDEFARKQFTLPFSELDEAHREALLRHIEKSPFGRDWLSLMIYYVFEALLADPVYGGNTGGIGWRWLEHEPGFPRPPVAYRQRER
jgi:gluconate 2-dehydrogenase gamma chain